MTDIVERLRWHQNGDSSIHDAVREAADEIERLRCVEVQIVLDQAEIERLRGDLLTGNSELLDQAEIENKRLQRCLDRSVGQANDYRAEVERLRQNEKDAADSADHFHIAYDRVKDERDRLRGALRTICENEYSGAPAARAALGDGE